MEPKPPRSPYYQPLVINGAMLLTLGLWATAGMLSKESSLKGLALFMLATLALPLVNACFFLGTLFSRRYPAAETYGLFTLIWGGLVWWFITYAAGAFHKIGG